MAHRNGKDTPIGRILRWEAGETPGPWSVTLFPTNKCNLPCQHCWLRWGEYDRTYKSEMPDERLLGLVDEAAALDVRDWTIVGGGDPMVRGAVVMDMCEKIRGYGMDGMLHTNGTLFKPSHFDRLIDMNWGRVAISLDGPTAESNDTIRGAGFDKAIKNVEKLSSLKAQRNVTRPGLSIHSVITNLNYDKIDQLVELAERIGCDTVNLTLLLVESELSEPFALTDAQKEELPAYVERGVRLADSKGIANNFRIFLRDEVIADSTHMPHGKDARTESGIASVMCFEPFTSVTIQPNGRVGPCCVFWDDDANSVKERSLDAVWLGPYLQSVRGNFRENRPMHYCALCPASLYARIENTRAAVVDRNLSAPQRAAALLSKGVQSLREEGVGRTVRRGLGWAQRLTGV